MTQKWMAVTTIVLPFEASHGNETLAKKEATQQIEELFLRYIPPEARSKAKIKVMLNRIKTTGKRERYSGPYLPENILPLVVTGAVGKGEQILFDELNGNSKMVNINSLRYLVFQRDKCVCQACGLVGTAMFLERSNETFKAHFNLYGYENGEEILFSKDHKHARKNGGSDDPSNLQTYCSICNVLKGHSDCTNEEIRTLRQIYNEKKKTAHSHRDITEAIQGSDLGVGRDVEYGKKILARNHMRKAQEIAAAPTVKLRETVVLCPVKNRQNGSARYVVHGLEKINPKKQGRYKKIEAGTVFVTKKRVSHSVLVYLDDGEMAAIHYTLLEPIYAPQGENPGIVAASGGAGQNSSGQNQETA